MPTLDDFHAIPDFQQRGLGFEGTCPACEAATLSLKVVNWGKRQSLDYGCTNGCRPGAIDVAIARLTQPTPKPDPIIEPAAPAADPAVPKMFAKLLTRAQLRALPPPVWQVENLFFEKSFIEVFGPPNQGKTFLASDISMALTMGGDWLGREILMPGPTFYVNADGGAGFSRRANAWAAANGEPDTTFEAWTYPEPVMLHNIHEMAELKVLLEYLPERPVLLVIDTYSQCLAGGNENLQEVASLVVQQVNDIKSRIGCSVMILHHSNATGQRDRGSTVISAAADTVIRVDQDEGTRIITASCRKQRDSEWFDPMSFRIDKFGEQQEFAWIVPTINEFTQTQVDRDHQERVTAYIMHNVGHSREIIAQNTRVPLPTVKTVVAQLIADGDAEEVFTPKDPSQRGPAPKGVRWIE